MLVRPPARLPDVATLADIDIWLQDNTLRNDFTEELEAWREQHKVCLEENNCCCKS